VQGVFRLPELRRLARAPAFVNLAFVDEVGYTLGPPPCARLIRASTWAAANKPPVARSSLIKPGHDDLRLSIYSERLEAPAEAASS
jgi:hypothetical protein